MVRNTSTDVLLRPKAVILSEQQWYILDIREEAQRAWLYEIRKHQRRVKFPEDQG